MIVKTFIIHHTNSFRALTFQSAYSSDYNSVNTQNIELRLKKN